MRMRRRNNLEPRMARCQQIMIPAPQEMAGRWRSLMPEARQVRVEVGCGKGKFTVETAQAEPDVLFIAIEKVREAMVLAMERAQEMGLKNVFFLDMDVAKLGQCFAPGEVDLIYINVLRPLAQKQARQAPPNIPVLPGPIRLRAAPRRRYRLQDGQCPAV